LNVTQEIFENELLLEKHSDQKTLVAKRAEGFELFQRKGLPTSKDEDWKFTNLNRLLKDDFRFDVVQSNPLSSKSPINGLDACTLVINNGKFIAELSDELPEGVVFMDYKSALTNPAYTERIGTIAPIGNDAMLGFNIAFFKHFYVLHIKAKKQIEKPIHISHRIIGSEAPTAHVYRLLIITEELSESTLIETFDYDSQNSDFVSYVCETSVAASSIFHSHLIHAGNEGLHLVQHREVEQFSNSTFSNTNLVLGDASLIRTNFNCRIKGTGTETNLYGSYILNNQQHADSHTIVDHQMPNSNSTELYKGIMMDRSHGVFNGKIFVRQDAQKTNAFQKNNNILLSDQATINSKPQLEIFADDVKCSHGSTVGQFDEEALFYLQTRGIGENLAKKMLIQAFIDEVHNHIPIESLKAYVNQLLQRKLKTDSAIT